MMNRLRTALVSVTAVAVAMMVLGSNARAKSVPTPSQQKYLRLLERLAEGEIKTGTSLVQRDSYLDMAIDSLTDRLENIPHPRPRLAREIVAAIAFDSNQDSWVDAGIQKNNNALLATEAELQALPPQEKAPATLQKNINALLALEAAELQALPPPGRPPATPLR